ncbi:MAG: hypothetical protein ACOH2E_06160 [Candidatus Paracaedibacter sp.]
MGLKNFQHKERGGGSFGTQAENSHSYLYWDEFSRHNLTNQPSSLSVGKASYSSVSLAPLPSFLTKTPLGTPCEETVELKPVAAISVRKTQEPKDLKVPLQRQAVDPTSGAPKRFKQKVEHGKKRVKPNQGARANGFIYHWIYEEVRLSMSKMSIVSLVLGLLFLGTLFFIIGFLAAVTVIGSSTAGGGNSASAWQASNTHSEEKKSGGKGFGHVINSIGGGIVGKAVGHQIGSLGKAVGTSTVVPKSLQPFARYGMGRVGGEVRRDVRQVNPFVPQRRSKSIPQEQQPYNPQQQQPYNLQQPGGPQQYASSYGPQGSSPQNPVYVPPSTAVGYQQPPATPQGGYNQGYALPQQQQMMQQQSYYPPPMQPQPYQQPLAQPIAPQQQQMPNPQYQQQMPPQQGYYR